MGNKARLIENNSNLTDILSAISGLDTAEEARQGKYTWAKYTLVSGAKGEFEDYVVNDLSGAYPEDGAQDGSWYVQAGETTLNNCTVSSNTYVSDSSYIDKNSFVAISHSSSSISGSSITLTDVTAPSGLSPYLGGTKLTDSTAVITGTYNTWSDNDVYGAIITQGSNGSISYGTTTKLLTQKSSYAYIDSARISDNEFVVVSVSSSNTNYYMALTYCSVSGSTITVGSELVLSGIGTSTYPTICGLNDRKVFVRYATGSSYKYFLCSFNTSGVGSILSSGTIYSPSNSSYGYTMAQCIMLKDGRVATVCNDMIHFGSISGSSVSWTTSSAFISMATQQDYMKSYVSICEDDFGDLYVFSPVGNYNYAEIYKYYINSDTYKEILDGSMYTGSYKINTLSTCGDVLVYHVNTSGSSIGSTYMIATSCESTMTEAKSSSYGAYQNGEPHPQIRIGDYLYSFCNAWGYDYFASVCKCINLKEVVSKTPNGFEGFISKKATSSSGVNVYKSKR